MSKSWSEEMVYRYQKEIQLLTKERDKLKKELNISNNALKLACNKLYEEMENPFSELYYYMADEMPDYFKTKAEENMKNEVNND